MTVSSTLVGPGPKVGISLTMWPGSEGYGGTFNNVYGVPVDFDTCAVTPFYQNPAVG